MFSPQLAKLQQHLDNLEAVNFTRADIHYATQLLGNAVEWYKTEEDHQRNTKSGIDSLIGEPGKWEENHDWPSLEWADRTRPAAAWWHNDFAVVILELKNTSGIGGDAILQAVVDYCKIITSEKVRVMPSVLNPITDVSYSTKSSEEVKISLLCSLVSLAPAFR